MQGAKEGTGALINEYMTPDEASKKYAKVKAIRDNISPSALSFLHIQIVYAIGTFIFAMINMKKSSTSVWEQYSSFCLTPSS